MTKQRNSRDRRLRRWVLRTTAVVMPDGFDSRGVGHVLPWCVEAYLARGPVTPRMSTRR